MVNKILFITVNRNSKKHGGRELLSNLMLKTLHHLFHGKVEIFELNSFISTSIFIKFIKSLFGYINGVNEKSISDVLTIVKNNKLEYIFIDGSNLGIVAAAIKREYSNARVITFYHNVESRFFWGSFLEHKTPRSFAVYIANSIAERSAAKYSDINICLSERDRLLLSKIYGAENTAVCSLAMEDRYQIGDFGCLPLVKMKYALFVGSDFYANISGITWFIKNVVPRIDIKIIVVGQGMDKLREEYQIPNRVEIIGAVDGLNEWYRNAHFIIAPIFGGSGMKTKVAEALMHGKKVVGTSEAFCGYELVVNQAGWVCNTADEFAAVINSCSNYIKYPFDPSVRKLYEEHYSVNAAIFQLKQILLS
jgi:glycosyltransferase involved in cell wall biosynthesis